MLYKLVFDVCEVDLNVLFGLLEENNYDFCFSDNVLYLYQKSNHSASISYIMEKINNKNYFLQKINKRPDIEDPKTFYNIWLMEKWDDISVKKIEREEQKKLKEMMANINKAKEDLKKVIIETENKSKGGKGHGRKKHE